MSNAITDSPTLLADSCSAQHQGKVRPLLKPLLSNQINQRASVDLIGLIMIITHELLNVSLKKDPEALLGCKRALCPPSPV